MQKVITKFDQFIRDAKEVRMRRFEKYAIRERLITEMEKDVPTILPATIPRGSRRFLIVILASVVALAAGGGAVFAVSNIK